MKRIAAVLFLLVAMKAPRMVCLESSVEPVVGIVSYQDYSRDQTSPNCTFVQDRVCAYTKYLGVVVHQAGVKHFRYTIGTYAEVLAWMRQGKVNIAMVTPGVASYVTSSKAMRDQWQVVAQEPDSPSTDNSQNAASTNTYSAVAVMANNANEYKSIDDVKKGLSEGHLKAIFIDPLSESGFIKPCEVLRSDCRTIAGNAEWTHDHDASRCSLLNNSGAIDPNRVTFMSSKDFEGIKDLPCYRGLNVPKRIDLEPKVTGLQKGCLLVSTVNNTKVSNLAQAMLDTPLEGALAWRKGDATSLYELSPEVESTMKQLEWNSNGSYRVTLEAISKELARYKNTHGAQFKLAIILSGAGSRGMYQAGLLESLMECLFEPRIAGKYERSCSAVQHLGLSNQEFIIGSSAGAINALAASYTCCDYANQTPIQDEWSRLNPYIALVPFLFSTASLNISISLVIFCVVLAIIEARRGRPVKNKIGTILIIGVCVELFVLGLVNILRCHLDSTAVVFVYAFLGKWWWLGPVFASALAILLPICKKSASLTSFLAALGTITVGLAIQFFYLDALFNNERLVEDLTTRIGKLSAGRGFSVPVYVMVTQLNGPKRTEEALTNIRNTEPRTHFAFGSIDEDSYLSSDLVAKIVAASSSVWPVFAPVTIDQASYIDGSFSHSSAISLATQLGATHAIVIHGSPENPISDGNFLDDIGRSIGVLFEEAQREDQTARELVHLYEIYPESDLGYGFWSFGGSRMRASGAQGRQDAVSQTPHYWQQLGPPRLEDPE